MRRLPCQQWNNFFDEHDRQFDYHTIIHTEHRNIQPFILKPVKYINNKPNDNVPNFKLKCHYNEANYASMMKYGTTKHLPHQMITILVEAWDTFKVLGGKYIRDRFVKKIYPLSSLLTQQWIPRHVMSLSKYLLEKSLKKTIIYHAAQLPPLRYKRPGLIILWFTWSIPRWHIRSHSPVCIKNYLFIVGIGPILNKEIEFVYQPDSSDRKYVYT